MRLHRLHQAAAVSTVLAWSRAAFAEVIGSVTTAPLGQAAPALGTPMLIAVAVAATRFKLSSIAAPTLSALSPSTLDAKTRIRPSCTAL